MIEGCILLAVFFLLTLACVVIVGGISYVFYQIANGREITVKMQEEEENGN